MVKRSFTKIHTLNLALASQAHFLEWRLTRFLKELFMYFLITEYVMLPEKRFSVNFNYPSPPLLPLSSRYCPSVRPRTSG